MTATGKNFSGMTTPPPPYDVETQFVGCNFAFQSPVATGDPDKPVGNRLWPGDDTSRSFRDCNLLNCETPPGSNVQDSNTTLTDDEGAQESIVIDGLQIDSVTGIQVTYGRWRPSLDAYEYLEPPNKSETGAVNP